MAKKTDRKGSLYICLYNLQQQMPNYFQFGTWDGFQ